MQLAALANPLPHLLHLIFLSFLFGYINIVVTQLSGRQILLQREHVVPVRFFAKEAAPSVLKGDG